MGHDPLADTADFDLNTQKPKTPSPPVVPSSAVEVRIGGESHRGHVRSNNEDCYLVSRFGRSLQTMLTNAPEEYTLPPLNETGYGMLVADGMGGPAAGEVASRSAVRFLTELVRSTRDWVFADDESHYELVMTRMADRFAKVDHKLLLKASENPDLVGMGTTMTLACSLGFELILCHIGDSRAYLFRDGALAQLTHDMTVTQELVDAGALDPVQARTHKLRHVLTQCLGLGDAQAHVQHLTLRDQDRLLLCSDGLTEMIADSHIAGVLQTVDTPEKAAHELVEEALRAGGRDNVTVVVADYRHAS